MEVPNFSKTRVALVYVFGLLGGILIVTVVIPEVNSGKGSNTPRSSDQPVINHKFPTVETFRSELEVPLFPTNAAVNIYRKQRLSLFTEHGDVRSDIRKFLGMSYENERRLFELVAKFQSGFWERAKNTGVLTRLNEHAFLLYIPESEQSEATEFERELGELSNPAVAAAIVEGSLDWDAFKLRFLGMLGERDIELYLAIQSTDDTQIWTVWVNPEKRGFIDDLPDRRPDWKGKINEMPKWVKGLVPVNNVLQIIEKE